MVLGHLTSLISAEYSPFRLFLLRLFAKYIEVPLLHLSYLACRGNLDFLSKFSLTRWLLIYPIAYPFGHWSDTGKPVPEEELEKMIASLEGPIAVGPCRCRIGHRNCPHPIETDIVIRTGTSVWLESFPDEYRGIEKEEAKRIIRDCASQGLFHMVFMHCLIGDAVNEYVICNCCTDGCVPYILNRTLGQKIYPLIKGEWKACVNVDECKVCGECVRVCPFGARAFINNKPEVLDCFGCGLCARACPSGASKMVPRQEQ